jgi:hypothetical protein
MNVGATYTPKGSIKTSRAVEDLYGSKRLH